MTSRNVDRGELKASAPEIRVLATAEALWRAAAERIASAAESAIAARGRFVIALSGGETARRTYEVLATPELARRVDWSRADVYWGDDRCVPPEDERSNYGMAHEVLLGRVAVDEARVHRMRGEHEPAAAAAAYERLMREHFGLDHGPPPAPLFDINHLGMGEDGHTASLFPGVEAVEERERWACPTYHEESDTWRVTLTPPVLNASRLAIITVSGEAKASRVREAIEGERRPRQLPVQVLAPHSGSLVWMLDEAAAGRLSRRGE